MDLKERTSREYVVCGGALDAVCVQHYEKITMYANEK